MTEFRPLVVVPTKDNAPTVGDVVQQSVALGYDVVVVDDGSSDGSGDRARAAGATVLVHPVNLGKGAALLTALRWADTNGYSHIVALDADGQHYPADIPKFVEAARAEPSAIVAGTRDMRTAPGRSKFGQRFSNFWIWAETGWTVEDSQCGFRVYPVAPVLALGLRGGRYEFEVDVVVRGLWAGIPVLDLACNVFYPPKEERQTSFRPFVDISRITLLNLRLLAERIVWPPRWRRHRSLRSTRWQDHHHGSFLGWWVVVMLIRWTGRWPAYVVATGLAGWFALFAGRPRRAVEQYGRRIGRSTFGSRWLAVRVFHAFSLSLVDRFLLLTRGADQFVFDRSEQVLAAYQAADAGNGLVVLSGHVGNPDLGAAAFHGRITRPVNVLQYAGKSDPYARLVREIAPERAPTMISINDDAQHASILAIRALRRGEIVAIKADRTVDTRTVEVPFLGGTIAIPTGPFLIAALSGAPTILLGCFKESATRYRVLATPAMVLAFSGRDSRDADIARWARDFASQLERWVKEYPEQWYQFHDPWLAEPEHEQQLVPSEATGG